MKNLVIGLLVFGSFSTFADCAFPHRTIINSKILSAQCFSYAKSGQIEFTADYGLSEVLPSTLKACQDAGTASMIGKRVSLNIQCVNGEEIITNVNF